MDRETQKKLLEKIKDDYEKIALEFFETRQKVWSEGEEFRKYIKDGDKILDLGCGNGRLYGLFQEKEVEYIGVDNSAKLVELARKKFLIPDPRFLEGSRGQVSNFQFLNKSQIPNPKPEFTVGDITKKLPFADNYFDVVFIVASFHHIPNEDLRKQVLKEIKRITKPNGLLIMTNWNFWNPKLIKKYKLWRLLFGLKHFGLDEGDVFIPWKLRNKEVIQRYYHAFTFREIKKLLKKTGWQILEQYYFKQNKKTNWLKGDNLVTIAKKGLLRLFKIK